MSGRGSIYFGDTGDQLTSFDLNNLWVLLEQAHSWLLSQLAAHLLLRLLQEKPEKMVLCGTEMQRNWNSTNPWRKSWTKLTKHGDGGEAADRWFKRPSCCFKNLVYKSRIPQFLTYASTPPVIAKS